MAEMATLTLRINDSRLAHLQALLQAMQRVNDALFDGATAEAKALAKERMVAVDRLSDVLGIRLFEVTNG